MYSPTQSSVFPESAPQRKLIHNRNLKLYVKLRLVITKVHRVLAFKQSPWLKGNIDFNTHQRPLSYSGFLEDFFILMNNSVFGKTQENLRKRVQVDIITDASILRKRVAKPSFCHGIPIYVGFTLLELSKLHMYEFHYQHMKVKYPYAGQLRLLFTDTGSLAYAVKTNSIYEDMATDASQRYDFSEYPYDHPLYDASNRKALGYFKNELNSIPMEELACVSNAMPSCVQGR